MLEELDDNSKETQTGWMRFLLERVGHNNLPHLLDYYKSIGWISDPVAQQLLLLANEQKRIKGTSWTLSAKEQRISRLYIEKLKGQDIDDLLLQVNPPGKAIPEQEKQIETAPVEFIHPVEKTKMEFNIHRRDITIGGLEKELGKKYAQIEELNARIRELEDELLEKNNELMKNKIYMEIMDQNTRIKKIARKKSANPS
ncbi:MAG: hypothetical protein OIN87_01365 [Candidatus Methanoperedens sp.]|nr:hypothetical protein [Candidatus Methanoperedens sp.]